MNTRSNTTAPVMPASSKIRARSNQKPRAEETLSFFRYATKADREAGADPLIFWNVQPSGNTTKDYCADVERGKAIAAEYLRFIAASPTYGNLTILASMLIDMQRFGDMGHRGLLVGFGSIIAKFSLIGVTVTDIDTILAMETKL